MHTDYDLFNVLLLFKRLQMVHLKTFKCICDIVNCFKDHSFTNGIDTVPGFGSGHAWDQSIQSTCSDTQEPTETRNLDWLGQSSLIYGRNFGSISLSWDVLGCVSSSLRSGLFSLQCGHGSALHSQYWRGTWRSLPRECVADPRNKVKICQDRQSCDVFFCVSKTAILRTKKPTFQDREMEDLDASQKAQTTGFRESAQTRNAKATPYKIPSAHEPSRNPSCSQVLGRKRSNSVGKCGSVRISFHYHNQLFCET